jgi:hypothetical protein
MANKLLSPQKLREAKINALVRECAEQCSQWGAKIIVGDVSDDLLAEVIAKLDAGNIVGDITTFNDKKAIGVNYKPEDPDKAASEHLRDWCYKDLMSNAFNEAGTPVEIELPHDSKASVVDRIVAELESEEWKVERPEGGKTLIVSRSPDRTTQQQDIGYRLSQW